MIKEINFKLEQLGEYVSISENINSMILKR